MTSGANGRTSGSPYDCPPFAVLVAIGATRQVDVLTEVSGLPVSQSPRKAAELAHSPSNRQYRGVEMEEACLC